MNNNIISLDDSNHSIVENSSSIRDYSNSDYSQPTLDTLSEINNIAKESTDFKSSIHVYDGIPELFNIYKPIKI